jgi:hypothetical protein
MQARGATIGASFAAARHAATIRHVIGRPPSPGLPGQLQASPAPLPLNRNCRERRILAGPLTSCMSIAILTSAGGHARFVLPQRAIRTSPRHDIELGAAGATIAINQGMFLEARVPRATCNIYSGQAKPRREGISSRGLYSIAPARRRGAGWLGASRTEATSDLTPLGRKVVSSTFRENDCGADCDRQPET